MALLDRLLHKKQEPEETEETEETTGFNLRSMVERAIRNKIQEQPYYEDLRTFTENLNAMRTWWPVLLPSLALIGLHTYRSERRNVLAQQKDLAKQQPQAQRDEKTPKPGKESPASNTQPAQEAQAKGKRQKPKRKQHVAAKNRMFPSPPSTSSGASPSTSLGDGPMKEEPQPIIAPTCRLSVVAYPHAEGKQRLTVVGHRNPT